jgi:hypothetical protein
MEPQQVVIIAIFLCVLGIGILEVFRRALWFLADRFGWEIGEVYDYVDDGDSEGDDVRATTPSQRPLPAAANGIATPQTQHNSAVVCCDEILTLTTEWNKHNERNDLPARYTGAEIAAKIDMLLRTQNAKKADGSPKIGETDLIKHGLGIQPGSGNVLYGFAKAAIAAERKRRDDAERATQYPPLAEKERRVREWIEE